MLEIRAVDRTDDHAAVGSIDTAFETSTIYALVVAPTRLDLVPQTLAIPRTKRYPIAEVFAPWSSWERGWIAEDGGVCGFAGVEYEAWHRRLVLWHLYVDRARRREGVDAPARARRRHRPRRRRARRALPWAYTNGGASGEWRAPERRTKGGANGEDLRRPPARRMPSGAIGR